MRNNWQLFWGQGQFLTPQHFQQQDLFHLWQQHFYWRLGHPFGWGVQSLQIREDGLAAGNLEILKCEVLTREGLILQAGSDFVYSNARISPRSFNGLMDPAGGPLSVYIGLPRYQNNQKNLLTDDRELAAGAMPPRFRLSQHERQDMFEQDTPTAQISFVEYNLPLFFDREESFARSEQASELIKIAELVPVAVGSGARLSPTFIPPCLNIEASAILAAKVRGVRDLLTSKGQEFEGLKRQRQDPVRLHMMQTLTRYIPLLHHLTEIGRAHPEPVYALLRQMIGEFSVFTEDISALGVVREDAQPDGLPPYDHERLAWVFERAIGILQDLVHRLSAGTEAGITLTRHERYFHASLPPAVFETERARYYLMIDSPVRGDVLWQRLQRTGKVSPIDDMPRLLAQAMFGLRIEFVPIPPEELPQRGGNKTFFQIDTKHPVWTRIRDQQNIALYCDLEPSETTIKLFVVRDE